MKFFIIIIIAFSLSIFLITGCEKEETMKSISNSSIQQDINEENSCIDFITNEQGIFKGPGTSTTSNPFDKNHQYLENIFQEITDFILDIEKNYESDDEYEIFVRDYERLMVKHERNNPYPKFEINNFSSSKQQIISDLLVNYMSRIHIVGITDATKETERTISLMNDRVLQESMYSVISQLSFTLSFMKDIEDILLAPSGADRMNNCMAKKLNAIWEDGNWIDQAGFILSIPTGPIGMMISCAWDVAFRPNLHHTPY